MNYTFIAYGHPNILATHPATIEITKDTYLTKKGDCIIAINADFSLTNIKKIIKNKKKLKLILKIKNKNEIIEQITADINHDFDDDHELILRKSNFCSKRTLGINASKSSDEIDRKIVNLLKNNSSQLEVTLITQ